MVETPWGLRTGEGDDTGAEATDESATSDLQNDPDSVVDSHNVVAFVV